MEHKGNWAISIPASSLGINSKSLEIGTRSLVSYNRSPQVIKWVKSKILLSFRVTDILPEIFLSPNDWTLIGLWRPSPSLKIAAIFKSIKWCHNFNQSVHVILSPHEERNKTIVAFYLLAEFGIPPLISSHFHLQRDWKVKKEKSVRDFNGSFSCCVYINWLEKPYSLLPVCCWPVPFPSNIHIQVGRNIQIGKLKYITNTKPNITFFVS